VTVTVTCPNGAEKVLPDWDAAVEYAEWGHFCVHVKRHKFKEEGRGA
jgi:hypothetical protein